MYRLKLILLLSLCCGSLSIEAKTITPIENIPPYNYAQYDYPDESGWLENRDTYCCPTKNSFLNKLKNAFIGQPMGFTPPINEEPSPYLNKFGPSYMRGYYGTNGWNDHNMYNPIYSTAGLHILD